MSAPRYCQVIEGELGPRYAAAFEGMTVRARNGKTEVIGPITDSSHLHGLFERIAGLGLRLHGVVLLEPEHAGSRRRIRTQPAGVNDNVPGSNRSGL